jgi:hypothetical protein
MQRILKLASDYEREVSDRATAHDISSEYHRVWGVRWGVIAAILAGLAGASTVAGVATELEPSKASLGCLMPVVLLGFAGIALLSSVASGAMHFLRHPRQAAAHTVSYAGYLNIKQRLNFFCLLYKEEQEEGKNKEEQKEGKNKDQALKDLERILKDIQKIAEKSISLTDKAYARARMMRTQRRTEGPNPSFERTV